MKYKGYHARMETERMQLDLLKTADEINENLKILLDFLTQKKTEIPVEIVETKVPLKRGRKTRGED